MSQRRSLSAWPGFDFALVGSVAFALRLAHAWFVAQTPFFDGPVIDAAVNRGLATQLAEVGSTGAAFYQPPLYPALLAQLFRLGLQSAWSVAVVQSLLGACTAVLLVGVGRRLASGERTPQDDAGRWTRARAVGLATGLGAALYGPLILFDLELLPPCCVDLLLASALWLALCTRRFGPFDAALGLACGLAVTGWPPTAVLVPGLLWLRARRLRDARLPQLVVALACAALPLAATRSYNARHGGAGVLVSYNLGINLWLGNNAHWRDTWRARPGASFEPELERPDRAGVTTPAGRSHYFVERALADVKARPLAALARTGEKLGYVWRGLELRRDQDIELLREASPVLRALLWQAGLAFPFGLLAPLAVLGLARRRREPDVRLLGASMLGYSLILAVFFVSSRYRLPLVLCLLPFAADQALWLVARGRRQPRALGALALLALLSNWPSRFGATFAASAAERGLLEASAWRNQGQLVRADALAGQLLQRYPLDPNLLLLQAELWASQGRCEDAVPVLKRAIELAPRTTTPRVRLADCAEQLGDLPLAQRELTSALALHPYHPLALRRACLLLHRIGQRREARLLLQRFLAAGYRDAWLAARVSGRPGV